MDEETWEANFCDDERLNGVDVLFMGMTYMHYEKETEDNKEYLLREYDHYISCPQCTQGWENYKAMMRKIQMTEPDKLGF